MPHLLKVGMSVSLIFVMNQQVGPPVPFSSTPFSPQDLEATKKFPKNSAVRTSWDQFQQASRDPQSLLGLSGRGETLSANLD
jgi:hypothetical protein